MSSASRTETVADLGYQPRHYLQRISPRIPILGDVEIVYHDDRGWQVDHSRFFMTYIGLVSFYIRMGDGPYFHLDGPYRISQRLPFSEMWYPPRQREFPDDIWNMVNRSVATSHVGMVQRGRRLWSVQTMYHYRRRCVVMSSDESIWESRTRYGRVYRRTYGEGEVSSRHPYCR